MSHVFPAILGEGGNPIEGPTYKFPGGDPHLPLPPRTFGNNLHFSNGNQTRLCGFHDCGNLNYRWTLSGEGGGGSGVKRSLGPFVVQLQGSFGGPSPTPDGTLFSTPTEATFHAVDLSPKYDHFSFQVFHLLLRHAGGPSDFLYISAVPSETLSRLPHLGVESEPLVADYFAEPF
jgi:hypothetical protein